MKKMLLSILTVVCLCGLSVCAETTNSTANSTTKPSLGNLGKPPQDGRITDNPAQEKPFQNLGKKPTQKPDKKPDKKPNKKPDKQPDKQPASKPSENRA